MYRDQSEGKLPRGFALVEALVIATIVALIAGITIIALTATTEPHASQSLCKAEATSFQEAVNKFNTRYGHWPGELKLQGTPGKDGKPANATPTPAPRDMALVISDLQTAKVDGKSAPLIPKSGLDHMNGVLKFPPTSDPGWFYDFDKHITSPVGCR